MRTALAFAAAKTHQSGAGEWLSDLTMLEKIAPDAECPQREGFFFDLRILAIIVIRVVSPTDIQQ